jgi:protein-tyrosine phosphatase
MIHATSDTHPIRVDVVPTPGLPGRLGLTFAPGKNAPSETDRVRWLRDMDDDLGVLRARYGSDVLVALLRPYEYAMLGVPRLVDRAERVGMTVHRFEIADRSVPAADQADAFDQLVGSVCDDLRAGRTVTVFCRGGLGRSGLVAACVLVRLGEKPARAVARVRSARPGAIETREQERYVEGYAERIGVGREAERSSVEERRRELVGA